MKNTQKMILSRPWLRIATTLLITLLTFSASPVFGQDDAKVDAQIAEFEAQAKEAYDKGDFDEAVRYLNKCNGLRPHPNYLVNIAFTYSEKGDCNSARTFANSAIEDPKIDESARGAASDIIKNCVEKQREAGATPPPKDDSVMPIVGWSLVAVGLTGLTALTVTDQLLLAEKEDLIRDCPGANCPFEDPVAEGERLEKKELNDGLEIGLFVGTSLMATAGLVILFIEYTDEEPAADAAQGNLQIAPLLGKDTAGLVFKGTF